MLFADLVVVVLPLLLLCCCFSTVVFLLVCGDLLLCRGSLITEENARREKNHSTECSGYDTSCSLFGKNELYLEPPPKYCGSCSFKITSKGSFYYVIGNAYFTAYEGYTNTVFCAKCYKRKASAGQIMVGNVGISKTHLVITRDIDDVAEPWVECGRCEAWQHQICELFNDDLNKDDTSGNGYMCPSCLLWDMEDGVCMPLPRSMVLSAENPPKTKLSNHLEKWFFRSLEKDRRDRENSLGRNCDEIVYFDYGKKCGFMRFYELLYICGPPHL